MILRNDIADGRLAITDHICAADLKTPPVSWALTSRVLRVMPLLVCPC
jgi:hypothetical protein